MRSRSHDTQTDAAGGMVNNHPAFGGFKCMRFMRALLSIVVFLIWVLPASFAQAQSVPTPPGTLIRNTAMLQFSRPAGGADTVFSNTASATVEPLPSKSALAILRVTNSTASSVQSTVGPTACRFGTSYIPLASPKLSDGRSINPLQTQSMSITNAIHGGEAVFVQVNDRDQNRDALAIDTIEVKLTSITGDIETVRLSETASDSGVFAGYIQTSAAVGTAGDCTLQLQRDSQIDVSYVDARDSADTSSAIALVDPFGLVFDSVSGQPVNGAVVQLINATTGQPAVVFGDDGVSVYPSIMTTGGQVTDSGGTVYTLPAGVYRFPLVAPGQYRLQIDPPLTHAFPSQKSAADLSSIPNAPFNIQPGSYGQDFTAAGPVAVVVDVPLDAADSRLFLQKTSTTTTASPGDFVQYNLGLTNSGTIGTFVGVSIEDRLPWGMRYRKNSTRVDGAVAADPVITPDGRTLTFAAGTLTPSKRVAMTYVAEITQSARGSRLTNMANASSVNGGRSNTAQATIQLRDDFFRDSAIVMGRVVSGECNVDVNKLPGISGVRVYLEDGRYSVTDDEGKYHFEGVKPGAHVVQMDRDSIPADQEISGCNSNVRHSGRSFSQFVDVRGGALWRADFKLKQRKPPEGSVQLSLSSTVNGQAISHMATVSAQGNDISNARLFVMLPTGVSYVANSARVADRAIDVSDVDGLLTFKLNALADKESREIVFATQVASEVAGAIDIKSYLLFDSPSAKSQATAPVDNRLLRGEMNFERSSYRFSPQFGVLQAQLQVADREKLDRLIKEWRSASNVHIVAIGHTDKKPITVANRGNYPDNHALSMARAQAVAEYLKIGLKLSDEQIQVAGKGSDEPIVKGVDEASLARNRRVEIAISGMRTIAVGKLSVSKPQATTSAATVGSLSVAPSIARTDTHRGQTQAKADFDVEKLVPGTTWLAPAEDDLQSISSVKVVIQHAADQSVELRLNDEPVSVLNFDGATTNQAKTIALSLWRGIDIKDGENHLTAIVRSADGDEVQRLTRIVRFGSGAVRAELVKESSTLAADGKTHPIIALRMFDASGKPARPGTQGAYRIDEPYRAWWDIESLRENQTTAIAPREPTFRVDDDGLARIELEPTTQTGHVTVHLRFNERQSQEINAWLVPQARDWILVGLAEGSAAYSSVSNNLESAKESGVEAGYEKDGRVAFFAKGRIKGEFLLTMAYDSDREREVQDPRLLGTIQPDRYYTVYGDGAEQRFEAASQKKLYVKLERQQFTALFGDFQTGLTVTELSRYSRTLTGFKSEFASDHFSYNAFAAQTDQGFVKDELNGDGTSGLYRLSQGSIIANSDKVRIEVRDRFRSEVIVETRTLTRYIDYNIDYWNGTLFFKEPIPSRDGNFNPVFIIAEYEVLQNGKEQLVAGGRAAVKFANDRVEVGTSFTQEGAQIGDTQLVGTDVRVRLNDSTQIRAEAARSESDNPARAAEANAYFGEVKHVSERVDAGVYFREQDANFGFGQQLSTEAGTRKYGVDSRIKLGETLSIRAEAYDQLARALTTTLTNAERQMASAELRHETQRYGVGVGARHVSDSGLTDSTQVSDLANVNGTLHLFNDRVLLKAAHDWSLNDQAESIDYPARSLLGVDYKLTQDTTMFTEYEHGDGQLSTDMTRVGLRASPWARAKVSSSVSQQFSEYGPRTFANLGLTQGWQINDRWAMDFSVDQSKTVRGNTQTSSATGGQLRTVRSGATSSPFLASGSLAEDFFASSVAAMYRGSDWTVNSRVEHRDSDQEQRWTYLGGFYREPSQGQAFSLSTQYLNSDNKTSGDAVSALIRMGWAYRPVSSEWIVLDRLDLKHDKLGGLASMSSIVGGSASLDSSRLINNLNVNWQMNARTQAGVQLGARYVVSTFDGERYSGLSTLLGLDARYDIGSRFDIGLHGTSLNSWSSKNNDIAVGMDLGITIVRNMWLSVGYNFKGFFDRDFDASRYTAQGPFVKLRIKADQDTFKDLSTAFMRPFKSRAND